MELREIYLARQDPARLPAAWRQAPDRGLGYRHGHPQGTPPSHLRRVPSGRQPCPRAQPRPGPRSGDRAAHRKYARPRDRRPFRPGKGSVFAVEVPLARDKPGAWAPNDGQTAVAAAAASSTVMIVEDDPMVREMLELLFKAEGHRTVSVVDGRKALELTASGTVEPDIVIADYNLPGRFDRPANHRGAARCAPARNSGDHPDRRYLDRHFAQDRPRALHASQQAGQRRRADASGRDIARRANSAGRKWARDAAESPRKQTAIRQTKGRSVAADRLRDR